MPHNPTDLHSDTGIALLSLPQIITGIALLSLPQIIAGRYSQIQVKVEVTE
jgi:hypothetical protein